MRVKLAFAAIAAMLLAASASAQQTGGSETTSNSVEAATLNDQDILWQDKATRDRSHDIALRVRNEVEVSATAKVSGLVNGEELALGDETVTFQPDCDGKTKFPIQAKPGKPCRIGVALNDPGNPGLYTAKVFLYPKAGDRKEVSLKFAVRRSVSWAIALVLAGLAAGFVVTSWRGGARERTRTIIAIKEAAEALVLLDSGIGRPPRMRRVLDRAREMVDALLRGVPVDAAEVAELQSRVNQYRFLQDLETRGAALPPEKQRELAIPMRVAIDAMMPTATGKLTPVPEATFLAVRDKLRELEGQAAELSGAGEALAADMLPLPVTQRMSSRTARLAFAVAEWAVAIILMLVFTVTALGTLYYGKTYWGSYGDLLAAFMIGFGAYAGAVASVDSFVQRARVVP